MLGGSAYSSPLQIDDTGVVAPMAYGDAGVVAVVARADLNDAGRITGASGYTAGTGGVGVELTTGFDTLINSGTIAGGYAFFVGNGNTPGQTGGNGVDIGSGALHNTGAITGGRGGYAYHPTAGLGGVGVLIESGRGATHVDSGGSIAGGLGGDGVNDGGAGGIGVDVSAGATIGFANTGTISGGAGGTADYYGGGNGGIGLAIQAGVLVDSLVNRATIIGGDGGSSLGFVGDDSGNGGAGVVLASGTFDNAGRIQGGASPLLQDPDFSFGVGGAGVVLTENTVSGALTRLQNHGSIRGGSGGGNGFGGGGNGVDVGVKTALSNYGQIVGGTGYQSAKYAGGDGGAGIYIDGGTVTNFGAIVGGTAGSGAMGAGATGDAVQFGDLAGTLKIMAGAVFDGDVVANGSVDDVLELGGTATGGIDNLGSKFSGFSEVLIDEGAKWLAGTANVLDGATSLDVDGRLQVTGSLLDAGAAAVAGDGILLAGGSASLQVGSVTLAGGTLRQVSLASVAVGAGTQSGAGGLQAGALTVEQGGTLSGYGGVFGTAIVDDGSIVANGGTLLLGGTASGTGSVAIDAGATAQVMNSLSAGVTFASPASGTLFLAPGASVTGAIAGFGGGDTIALRVQATTLSFAGGVLTLDDGTTKVASLNFAGTYTTANFVLSHGAHHDALIRFVAGSSALPDFASAAIFGASADTPSAGPTHDASYAGLLTPLEAGRALASATIWQHYSIWQS
jgi:hypothetical protein